jgi:hypothetical protein
MRMPGFTGEASLYNTSEHYQMGGAVGAPAGGAAVVPQAFGCVSRTFSIGPASISIRCCAFPPGCTVRICLPVIGCHSKSFP